MNSDAEKLQYVMETLKGLLHMVLPPPRILVVEDSENDRVALKRELDKFKCSVTFCGDSEEAIKIIKDGRYDLILLDQQMPKLTGNEIMQATAGFRDNSRVIIVTGYPGAPQTSRALEQGASLILHKPVSAEQLSVFLTPYDT